MKIAFDVDVIKDLGITKMVEQVADWGLSVHRAVAASVDQSILKHQGPAATFWRNISGR